MSTMNFIGKIRVRSLEELNSNINLNISNFVEIVSENDNTTPVVQHMEIQDYLEEDMKTVSTLYPKPPKVMQIETYCVNPALYRDILNPIQQEAKPIKSTEESTCPTAMDQSHFDNAYSDLGNVLTQTILDSSNIGNKPEQESPVENIKIEIKTTPSKCREEMSDNSICFMEYVETVFGVGCNGEDCSCAPIQLQNEEKTFSENPALSHIVYNYLTDIERPVCEKEKNNSLDYTDDQLIDNLEITSKSTKSNIDDKIGPQPSPHKTESLNYTTNKNNSKPNIISLDEFFSSNKRIIPGTTFCIDEFKHAKTENVTAVFLTHFHLDHLHRLKKRKFSKPIYLSRITATILRDVLPVNELMLKVMDLNNTITIDGVKVTALNANYCPGAIMLLFQLSSGLNVLYTGDFRASSAMELNPFLRANKIDVLYLDTAYISSKISSQSQEKSISDAITIIQKFKLSYYDKRILFLFGHIGLGNDELWLDIADKFDLKVWTDEFNLKMLTAIGNEEYIQRFVLNAEQADMHLIQHSNLSYHGTNEHWKKFKDTYDIMLAIKPKQWVENKCREFYKGEINIVEVEYSSHSNETEIRKFLAFLQPKRVITISPVGKDQKYPEVPLSWYKEKWFSPVKKQASMYDFFKVKPKK
ncbi:uncharacterized protein LOC129920917 isoform X1 [Episyrphus balteatus]|uniref:uncharacterized protein LOC129920917 isoform X1 n=1 Tax=Episyrphus balteatus TaxID=286459 RepID=UPI00248649BF|nr:uncharacterized protein LOC129920917 isoform X1 [Episyrphus balteatus]